MLMLMCERIDSRNRMPKTRTVAETCGGWACAVEVCVFTSGVDVCYLLPTRTWSLYNGTNTPSPLRPELFEEYTRRQYVAKAPNRNPFGDEETAKKFNELDIFQRIRVLQQLTVWTFGNPDRIREKMAEQKEMEQTQWVGFLRLYLEASFLFEGMMDADMWDIL